LKPLPVPVAPGTWFLYALDMPLPLIPLVIGALIGNATKKTPQKKAVSGYTKKNGTKVRAYTKKAK